MGQLGSHMADTIVRRTRRGCVRDALSSPGPCLCNRRVSPGRTLWVGCAGFSGRAGRIAACQTRSHDVGVSGAPPDREPVGTWRREGTTHAVGRLCGCRGRVGCPVASTPHGAAIATRVGSERRTCDANRARVFAAHTRRAALFIATWDRSLLHGIGRVIDTPVHRTVGSHVLSDDFAPQKRRATLFTDPCDRSRSHDFGCAIDTRRCRSVP